MSPSRDDAPAIKQGRVVDGLVESGAGLRGSLDAHVRLRLDPEDDSAAAILTASRQNVLLRNP